MLELLKSTPGLNRLARFLGSHWDEQPRVEILGVEIEPGQAVIRFRASRITEYVQFQVQHSGPSGGGSTFNDTTYVERVHIDCRLNRQQDRTVTLSQPYEYFIFVAPKTVDGDGTSYIVYSGAAGEGEDFMAFVNLGGGLGPVVESPGGDKWSIQVNDYGSLTVTNLTTLAVRKFYAIEEGTDLPSSLADETIFFRLQP